MRSDGWWMALVLVSIGVAEGGAQAAPNDSVPPPRTWRLGGWLGLSPNSPVGERLGLTPGRAMLLAGVRATRTFAAADWIALEYAADLVPLAVVAASPFARPKPDVESAMGVGLSPVGLRIVIAPHARVRPHLEGSAGALWFTRDVPVPDARRFNYAFEYGGGLAIGNPAGRSWLVGYRFHHLSNFFSAHENPGLDANLFYLGMTLPGDGSSSATSPAVAAPADSLTWRSVLRTGRWGAQFHYGPEFRGLGVLRMLTPRHALTVDLGARFERRESVFAGGEDPAVPRQRRRQTLLDLTGRLGVRTSWALSGATSGFLTLGLSGSLTGLYPHYTAWGAGAFADLGASYLVTSRVAVGASGTLAAHYARTSSDLGSYDWTLRVSGPALVATLYF